MPYSIRHLPTKGRPPWAKVNKETGRVVSRHRTRARAQASVRAYYATKNQCCNHHLVSNARLLRADPTRTLGISRRFMADIRRRMRKVMTAIRVFLVDEDELGLKERTTLIRLQRTYEFRTDAGKVQAFREWLTQQMQANVLSVPAGADPAVPWTSEYIESSYRRGLTNAWISSRDAGVLGGQVGEQSQEEFIRSSFAAPETTSKIELLATRSFEGMRGITGQVAADLNRILAQGIADGINPREIARQMQASIGSLTRRRAETIARTEVIHAHAEGQLDAFTKLGVEELGVKAEWSTAGDDRVCPFCAEREGQTYTIEEARGLIPLHPNCRCTWIPAVAGAEDEPATSPEGGRELIGPDEYADVADRLSSTPLSNDEKQSGGWYGTAGYRDINTYLRKGVKNANKEVQADIESHIVNMDNVIDRSRTPESLRLYRGIGADIDPPIGKVMEDQAYVSVSSSLEVAKGFLLNDGVILEVRVPAGSRMASMKQFTGSTLEEEFILPRGSKLFIRDEVVVRTVDDDQVVAIVADLISE